MSAIGDQLRQIAAQIDGGSSESGAGMVMPGRDGLAIVDGVVLAIDEPIRSDWKVSMEARQLCAQGRIGYEPSNAFNSGLPKRSPGGYPMFYGVGAFGPVGPGRVKYDGSTFANDAEVEAYKAAIAQRPAAGTGGEHGPYAGKYKADAIAQDRDAAAFVYAYTMTQPGSALANKVYYQAGLFEGDSAAVARLIGAGEGGRRGRGVGDEQIVADYPDTPLKRDVLAVTV